MKNTDNRKGSLTKSLLAGLDMCKAAKSSTAAPAGGAKTESKVPTFGKTITTQADLAHDPGNGYNPGLVFPQD